MALVEDVPDQPVVLAQVDAAAVAGEDTRGVLAAVLQNRKPVVEGLVNLALRQDTDDAAHAGRFSSLKNQV